jgi:hypothetical protein
MLVVTAYVAGTYGQEWYDDPTTVIVITLAFFAMFVLLRPLRLALAFTGTVAFFIIIAVIAVMIFTWIAYGN